MTIVEPLSLILSFLDLYGSLSKVCLDIVDTVAIIDTAANVLLDILADFCDVAHVHVARHDHCDVMALRHIGVWGLVHVDALAFVRRSRLEILL